MVVWKKNLDLQEIGKKPEDPGIIPVAEFRVFGQEMIEKKVKTSGKTGRVYLPGNWVGKQVKIIRID